MIFITAKFRVLPEHAEDWPEISREFTEATRGEDGCLWFAETPRIVNFEVPGTEWSELGELHVD
ncbi:MAG: putative quinol monooxygenase [Nocardioidaceae bacterium]